MTCICYNDNYRIVCDLYVIIAVILKYMTSHFILLIIIIKQVKCHLQLSYEIIFNLLANNKIFTVQTKFLNNCNANRKLIELTH